MCVTCSVQLLLVVACLGNLLTEGKDVLYSPIYQGDSRWSGENAGTERICALLTCVCVTCVCVKCVCVCA